MVEEPPHSRIFILHSRETKEEDIENAFKKFGQIEHTWRVKDKFTGENKGKFYTDRVLLLELFFFFNY